MFLKRILWVLLLLVWGAAFNSICAAAPLMVEKNLFSTDRKPPPPESADASPKPAKPGMAIGNIQLDGVIFESDSKRAILRMKSQPVGAPGVKGRAPSPFVTVREGQTISDYRVSKIESKSILLEKDGQTFVVGLFAANKVLPPVSPAPAPAPVQLPPAEPGVAPQQAGADEPAGVQPQPGYNPQNPQQLPRGALLQPGFNPQNPRQAPPGQAAPIPPSNPRAAGYITRQPNPYTQPAGEQVIDQEPNQAAEVVGEEE